MIEFSNIDPDLDLMYFSGDGTWGSADDIAIVKVIELDSHWAEMMDELPDHHRPDFMRWFVDNQCHDQQMGEYTNCVICEQWDSGLTEDEIQSELEDTED